MRRRCLVVLSLLTVPALLDAQAAASAAGIVPRDSVEAVFPARMRELGIPGASVTVIRNGQVVLSRGFGLADVELDAPARSTTRYRVGSIAKPFTAVALGILVDEGRLDLDAEVQRYVPGFPRKPWPITVRQLAGHQAGIRHYKDGEFENQQYYPTLLDGLRMFEDDSLLFEPGTKFSYSSFGYNLLGAVIEGASGVPYLQFMRDRVFKPLGMNATVADFPDSIIPGRTSFYAGPDDGGPLRNAPYVDNSYKWPSGGFLSTTEDLARFGQALLEGKLLAPRTRDMMWTAMPLRDGTATSYGVGWNVGVDAEGRRYVSHTGGSVGGISVLVLYLDTPMVVAITVNTDKGLNTLASRVATWYTAGAVTR